MSNPYTYEPLLKFVSHELKSQFLHTYCKPWRGVSEYQKFIEKCKELC